MVSAASLCGLATQPASDLASGLAGNIFPKYDTTRAPVSHKCDHAYASKWAVLQRGPRRAKL